jgi:hypothetical protein
MTRVLFRSLSLLLAFALLAASCGSDGGDDSAEVTSADSSGDTAGDATDNADDSPSSDDSAFTSGLVDDEADEGSMDDDDMGGDELPAGPIPVEPDGGIGDGAGPIPGFEEEEGPTSDWHGAELAVTNCPGMDFQRVEAAAFSFSVPTDFVDQDAQGIDSEVGIWSRDGNGTGIEVLYDYGWYSSPVADFVGAEVNTIDYSGFVGDFAVVRELADAERRSIVGVYFPDVETDGFQGNALSMIVQHDDPNDEIIGRCIVGSIEWKVSR